MKAAYIDEQGGPEVLQYGDLPDPQAGPGEIVVDIHAASVNAADWKVRAGSYAKLTDFPYVLGRDFSGVVAGTGAGVTDLAPGDPVFGVLDAGQEGAYAEKVAVKASLAARKPDGWPHEEAVALALAGLTAIVSLEDTLQLRAGETILIQGGAGGVAGFAIQLAKHIGATVVTTASADNHDYVRSLGADRAIDYRARDFTEEVSGCRRRIRDCGRRCRHALVRRPPAWRPGGLHRLGRAGAGVAARRRKILAAERRARPALYGTGRRTGRGRRRNRPADPDLPARPSSRRPPRQRRPPPQGQAGSDGAVERGCVPTQAALALRYAASPLLRMREIKQIPRPHPE